MIGRNTQRMICFLYKDDTVAESRAEQLQQAGEITDWIEAVRETGKHPKLLEAATETLRATVTARGDQECRTEQSR